MTTSENPVEILYRHVLTLWKRGPPLIPGRIVPLLNQLLELDPFHISGRIIRSSVFYIMSSFEKSYADSAFVVQIDGSNSAALSNIASFHFARGRHGAALNYVERAIDHDPQYLVPRLNRANICLVMGRYDDCIDELSTIARIGNAKVDRERSAILMAKVLAKQEKLNMAMRTMNAIAQRVARYKLGNIFWNTLAMIHNKRQEYPQGINAAETVLAKTMHQIRSPKTRNIRAIAYLHRAEAKARWCLAKPEHPGKSTLNDALEDLKASQRLDCALSRVHLVRSMILAKKGYYHQAVSEIGKALSMRTDEESIDEYVQARREIQGRLRWFGARAEDEEKAILGSIRNSLHIILTKRGRNQVEKGVDVLHCPICLVILT